MRDPAHSRQNTGRLHLREAIRAHADIALLALALSGAAAGCGDKEGADGAAGTTKPTDPSVSIRQAIAARSQAPQRVRGYLVSARNQPIRLCESLAESFPPQCGEPSLTVYELDLEKVEGMRYEDGVSWTEGPIELIGPVRKGVLVIEDVHR
ncbi:MAG: hypothetical protein H0T09_03055 [Actinobacteria bacterium]|nr:hypothetical protein [Actinomycetota bacterium]